MLNNKQEKLTTSIEFVNHASVLIKGDGISILSDPWFEGDAFHKGWDLLHKTNDIEGEKILDKTTHIWLSHEHPDHFSVLFFKKFKTKIIERSIKILFQETKDKRVLNFLKSQSLECQELRFNQQIYLSKLFSVTCIKDGFYDSGILIKNNDEKILNLNDCEINTPLRIEEVKAITGEVDVLLTQFSFAAWKGGKKNKKWRLKAAEEKLNTMKLQIEHFKPNFVIPFASFIYFSNFENSYLNDAANKPDRVFNELKNTSSEIIIMKPNDIIGGKDVNISILKAIDFWNEKYDSINNKQLHCYNKIPLNEIYTNF
jgi:UDP-MurNAc hydroxylase